MKKLRAVGYQSGHPPEGKNERGWKDRLREYGSFDVLEKGGLTEIVDREDDALNEALLCIVPVEMLTGSAHFSLIQICQPRTGDRAKYYAEHLQSMPVPTVRTDVEIRICNLK